MLETLFLFFICKKPGEIPIFGTFLAKKLIFLSIWSMFTENPLFESGHVWKRYCDVIRWPIFMILVSMERRDPTLYHGIYQTTILWARQFQVHKGVVTTPLGKPCYKKRLGRTRVNVTITFFLAYSSYLSIFHQLVLLSSILVTSLIKSALIQSSVHHVMKLMAMMYI